MALSASTIRATIAPRLRKCRVQRITLTGGEPFVHPEIDRIVTDLHAEGFALGLCTNGTNISNDQIKRLASLAGIHINVSLDGFNANSHGRFRGSRQSFYTTIKTIRKLAEYGLLQGLLVTPNQLAEEKEYASLCEFAIKCGAQYVLMNPLSSFGRGVQSSPTLGTTRNQMSEIQSLTRPYEDDINISYIRFPNDSLPLSGCEAGNIFYVFANGDVAICPYLVFAARNPRSQHEADEFIVGNMLQHSDIASRLDGYRLADRYRLGGNAKCGACELSASCGKGCPAAIVASGRRIESVDEDVCPKCAPDGSESIAVARGSVRLTILGQECLVTSVGT